MKFLIAMAVIDGFESRPARGAWVEIVLDCAEVGELGVAPRKGRVG